MIPPGTRLGNLRIDALLGRGGMGEVYRGEQVSLKRPVAIKRIADHLLADEDAVHRFAREAQVIAHIHSPHVVAVHEFGQYQDVAGPPHWLLVLELVEGGLSLGTFAGKPMPWAQATSVIRQAAEGLATATEQGGVVHRDIKPDNIMLTAKGVAKLTDFGLAKSVDSSSMTLSGTIMGTPAYMPPEVCRGETSDTRGDLYSLGATWFQLLAGRTPFHGRTTLAMLRAHNDEAPPDLRELSPELPTPIAALVARLLAKRPEDRLPNAQALVDAIDALAAQGLAVPRTVPELAQQALARARTAQQPTAAASAPDAATVAPGAATAATVVPGALAPTQPTVVAGRPPAASIYVSSSAAPAPIPDPAPTAPTGGVPVIGRRRSYAVPIAVAVAVVAAGAIGWLALRPAPGTPTASSTATPTTVAAIDSAGPLLASPEPVPTALKPGVAAPVATQPTAVADAPPALLPAVAPSTALANPPEETPPATPVAATADPAPELPAQPTPTPQAAPSPAERAGMLRKAIAEREYAAAEQLMAGMPAGSQAVATARTAMTAAERAWDGQLDAVRDQLDVDAVLLAHARLREVAPEDRSLTTAYQAKYDELAARVRAKASAVFNEALLKANDSAAGGNVGQARLQLMVSRGFADAAGRLDEFQRALTRINRANQPALGR